MALLLHEEVPGATISEKKVGGKGKKENSDKKYEKLEQNNLMRPSEAREQKKFCVFFRQKRTKKRTELVDFLGVNLSSF